MVRLFESGVCLTSLKTWMDLAEVLSARLMTPNVKEGVLWLHFKTLKKERSWHTDHPEGDEKYGVDSEYAKVKKNHEPHFVKDYHEALERCKNKPGAKYIKLRCEPR